jgi:excisionase family DNA binding protein
MEKADDVYSIDDLAGYLKVPKSTLYKLVREGRIPAQKVGRHWRFHKEAIVRWLGNRKESVKPDR